MICFKESAVDIYKDDTTRDKVYIVSKAQTSVSIPTQNNGRWVHKVAIVIDGKEAEMLNYKEGTDSFEFVADLNYNSYVDTKNYEIYYIYNYSDGDYDIEIANGNITAADEDDGKRTDDKKLYKLVAKSGILSFEVKEA